MPHRRLSLGKGAKSKKEKLVRSALVLDAQMPTIDDLKGPIFEEERACHALGLRVDFLHRSAYDQLPKHCAQHLTTEEWICNFLKENYKAEKQLSEPASLSDGTLLQRIGFRYDTADTVLNRASAMSEHLDIADWLELYVRDEFKYNPVISGIKPKFPFRHESHEQWLALVNNSRRNQHRRINALNLERRPNNSTSYPEQGGCRSFPRDLEDETHRVLFHGTDHESARHIIFRGIRTTQGRKNRDFSSGCGFYLTDDLEHAVEWAFSSTRKPAVLVYRVRRNVLETSAGYSLVGKEKANKWVDFVKQYRSGKPSKKLRKSVRDYDYVEGARSLSSRECVPTPIDKSYQMCVISVELAERLDGFLHSVVFYSG